MERKDKLMYPLNPPLLEMLVLSIIGREDSYGYQISQRLKAVSSLKDSALYPVLKRLSESGLMQVYDRQYQGRNRKYYQITELGKAQCDMLAQEWELYTNEIQAIMEGKDVRTGGVEE